MNLQNSCEMVWFEGGIPSATTSEFIERINESNNTGGIDIFIGQIRADIKGGQKVKAIQYTTHKELANKVLNEIIQNAVEEFKLTHVYVCHSIGDVFVGSASLLVIAAAAHRVEAFEGCRAIVEKIKSDAPIWGQEIMENEDREWKVNS